MIAPQLDTSSSAGLCDTDRFLHISTPTGFLYRSHWQLSASLTLTVTASCIFHTNSFLHLSRRRLSAFPHSNFLYPSHQRLSAFLILTANSWPVHVRWCCLPTSFSDSAADAKVKFHPLRTQRLKVLPLKPEVGKYITIHARLLSGISSLLISTFPVPRSGELRMQKLKSHLARTQSLNVLPLKPGVGHNEDMHASPTARDFFIELSTFRSIHLHFFQTSPDFFPVLAVADTGSCVGPQNKTAPPTGCRFPCWVPAEYK